MARKTPPNKLGPEKRMFQLRTEDIDTTKRTARFSFSSETPVEMWYGQEILDHSAGSVRLNGARQKSMPLLYNHDRDDLLGIIETVEIDGRRGYANSRFGKDERGEWAMNQAADGILVNSSFLYRVYSWTDDQEYEDDDDEPILRCTDWEPYEVSLVTVPADASVGIGRAADGAENPVLYVPRKRTVSLPTRGAAPPTRSNATMDPENAPNGGAGSGGAQPVDMEAVKREARETERRRMQAINQLAADHGFGQAFISDHINSTVEVAREAALRLLATENRDRSQIQAREQERIREIQAIGAKAQLPEEMVRKAIEDKTSIENFRGVALERLLARGSDTRPVSGAAAIDLSPNEARSYSLTRAIMGALTGSWKEAGFEREISETIAKSRDMQPRSGNAFFMPTNIPFQVKGAPQTRHIGNRELQMLRERAAYAVGGATTGGNLVETNLWASDFIEVLRNRTVTGQLGARYLPGLTGNVNIPRQNSQTQTYWVGESVALTESEATFDQVQLRPHVVGALSKMSRLTLQQTTPAIEQLVRDDLLQVEALAVDLAALNGTGSSAQPTGIANTSGVGSVVGGTNGANSSFDMMIQLYTAPSVANAPQENLGFAINAKTRGYLATLKSTTGQYLWNQDGPAQGIARTLLGYNYALSNQLPSNLTKGTSTTICSEAMFGNWQELFIAEWGVTEIMVNPYDTVGFTTGDVLIRAFQTLDIGVRHPASFAVISDMLTPGF
jgi:HK97 family phage major capsid protein